VSHIFWGCASQTADSIGGLATDCQVIRTVHFSPGFFENKDPEEAVISGFWESGGKIPMVSPPTREVIINFNHLEFTIDAKIDCILTKFIHFICFEDSPYQVRILSEGS
jgi:hypothetical protein